MPALAVVLIEVLIEEILLLILPDDPASLVRAALVCEEWRRIVGSPGFRRRFREFHRTPPVLGVLCNYKRQGHARLDEVHFIPTASSSPIARADYNHRAVDARHGRVLLHHQGIQRWFVVWDPMTHMEYWLPPLPRRTDNWNAAVVCAAAPSGACDHFDCHRGGHFLVVVVEARESYLSVHVYSSECGRWTKQSLQRPDKPVEPLWPSVLVGNELCFMLQERTTVLKYNLSTKEVSVLDLPPSISYKPDVLTTTEDGNRLGFATVHKARLYLWSKEDGPEDIAGWTKSRVIQLDSLLPANALLTSPTAIGFAAGVCIVFMCTDDGLFSIDLKSQQARKIHKAGGENVVPYMNFYTPAVGLA